jgi:hypothetical protein
MRALLPFSIIAILAVAPASAQDDPPIEVPVPSIDAVDAVAEPGTTPEADAVAQAQISTPIASENASEIQTAVETQTSAAEESAPQQEPVSESQE